MDEWRWSGMNPIVRAAIGIEFTQPFLPPLIHEAASRHPSLKKVLPRRVDQTAMLIQMGQGSGPAPFPMMQGQPSGFVLDKTNEKGEQIKAISFFGNSLIFSAAIYSRWNNVWAEAEMVLNTFLPLIGKSGNAASSATLEYVNRIFWSGDPETADISSLFDKGPFVVPNAFRVSGYWHSFHGFFRDAQSAAMGKHLENINISVADRPEPDDDALIPRRCAEIVINHRVNFSQPISFLGGDEEKPFAGMNLGEHTTSMHNRNKDILRSVLTHSIVARIPGLGVV